MKRKTIIFIALLGLGTVAILFFSQKKTLPRVPQAVVNTTQIPQADPDTPLETIIATGFDTIWGIVFLPDKSMLITERLGTVRFIDREGNLNPTPAAMIPNVKEIGEGGLMGIEIHPQFETNHYVYLYYTYGGSGNDTLNRVVRMKFKDAQLEDEQTIIDEIPGNVFHNGGRIKFGPDGLLYVTTGDAQDPSLSQNRDSLAGKILRVTDEGRGATGNPFGTRIYSLGHRNPQGIAWDKDNQLWETEHGPSGGSLGSGQDEVNKIEPGRNYGWPTIKGDQPQSGMEKPYAHSGRDVWAPGGMAIVGDSLFFSGLRGSALYEVNLSDNLRTVKEHFKNTRGRIREVILGPDGMLYITTSNLDGRGIPHAGDDKIIKVNPQKL